MRDATRTLEKSLGKVSDYGRFVGLATENIQIDRICHVGKMSGNERCFDQLYHRVPGNPFILSKVNNCCLTEPFHLNQVTQFNHKLPNLFGAADRVRVAIVDIEA